MNFDIKDGTVLCYFIRGNKAYWQTRKEHYCPTCNHRTLGEVVTETFCKEVFIPSVSDLTPITKRLKKSGTGGK